MDWYTPGHQVTLPVFLLFLLMRHLFVPALACFIFLASAGASHAAQTPPSFPACPNPGGSLKATYASGTHGIPGDSGTYTGSDSVYTIDAARLVQCFCPAAGTSGIQTNWWQVADPSQSDITSLKSAGWVYIPDGSAWGLQASIYFAQNTSFSCGTQSGGNGGFSQPGPGPAWTCPAAKPPAPTLLSVKKSGTSATLTWTKVDQATHYAIWYGTTPGRFDYGVANTGQVTQFTVGSLDPSKAYYWEVRAVNDCMPSDAASVGGGQVLGAFAPTGNQLTIIIVAALGLILLGLSLLTRDRRRPQA